jgi:hypothetical protein
MSLCCACLLAMACQTTGTPGRSPVTAATQSKGTPAQAQAAETQAKSAPSQPQASVERQAVPGSQPAKRAGTAAVSAGAKHGARPAASVRKKGAAGKTLGSLKTLYSVITGKEINSTKIIDSAIAAAVVVVAIGAFVAVIAIRRRRPTPTPRHAER